MLRVSQRDRTMATRFSARSLLSTKRTTSSLFSRSYTSLSRSTPPSSLSDSSSLLRPLAAHFHRLSTATPATRGFATRRATSSPKDPKPKSNRPPKESILLEGCDFKHWLVVMETPAPDASREEIIDGYIYTLGKVMGSEDEAMKKIYSVSTRHYYAFGANVSEDIANKLKNLDWVRWVLPDCYLDVKNKDYGGEPFIDGKAVPYDPKYHAEWLRNNDPQSLNKSRRRENRHDPNLQMGNRDVQNPGFNSGEKAPSDLGGQPNMGGMTPSNMGVLSHNMGQMPRNDMVGVPPNNMGGAPNMGARPGDPPNMGGAPNMGGGIAYNTPNMGGVPYNTPNNMGGVPYNAPNNMGGVPYNTPNNMGGMSYNAPNNMVGVPYNVSNNVGVPYNAPNNVGGVPYNVPNNMGGVPYNAYNVGVPYNATNNMGGLPYNAPNNLGGEPYQAPNKAGGMSYGAPTNVGGVLGNASNFHNGGGPNNGGMPYQNTEISGPGQKREYQHNCAPNASGENPSETQNLPGRDTPPSPYYQ